MDRFPGAAGLLGLGGSPFVREQTSTSGGTSVGSSTVAAFTSGTIDGTTIGGSTPAAARFTTLQATTIGGVTPGAATFTTVNATTIGGVTPGAATFTTVNATGAATFTTLQATTIGGVTPGAGTFTTVNATGAGYYIGGSLVISTQGNVNGLYLGVGAGINLSNATNENTLVGNLCGNQLTTAAFCTGLGEHALGYETTGDTLVAIGNDCMRNSIGQNNAVGVGKFAMACYFGQNSTGVGYNALVGNSASIVVSGTKTTGDIINVVFTSSAIVGSPVTASYTVLAGDTIATIQAGIAAAIPNVSALNGANISARTTTGSNAIAITYNGTSAVGTTLTVSYTQGGNTEVLTITNGVLATVTDNIAIGQNAMAGYSLTSAAYNIGIGGYALANASTALNCFAAGYNALTAATSAQACIGIGTSALQATTTTTGSTAVGNAAGSAAITAIITAFGYSAGKAATAGGCTYIGYVSGENQTSGANNCALGSSALLGAASSTASACVAIGQGSQQVVSSATGNVSIGHLTANAITSGSYGVYIGYLCAQNNAPGNGNIWISSGSTTYSPTAGAAYTLFIGAMLTGATATISATGMNSTTPLVTMPGGSLTLGVSTVTGGSLILMGSTSGSVTVKPPAVAGSATVVLAPGASAQSVVAAPTAPASTTTYFMQGLAGSITPASSGKLHITMSGTVVDPSGTAAGNGILYQISYGTGTAPSNAGALAGTQVGAVQSYTSPNTVIAVDTNVPFALTVVVTGLVVGTAYWLDLASKSLATASSMGLANISISAMEFL